MFGCNDVFFMYMYMHMHMHMHMHYIYMYILYINMHESMKGISSEAHYCGFRMFWVNIRFLVASYRMSWHVPVVTAVWISLNMTYDLSTKMTPRDHVASCHPANHLSLISTHTQFPILHLNGRSILFFRSSKKHGFLRFSNFAPSSSQHP